MSAQCCNDVVTSVAPHALIPLGIIISSLFGSAHCVGMCGGLMIASKATTVSSQVMYHLGRLISYTLVGAVLGAIGSMIKFNASPTLHIIMGIFTAFVLFGVSMSIWSQRPLHVAIPYLTPILSSIHSKVLRSQHSLTSLFIGLFTIGLPCGWLYVFLLGAASTGSAVYGGLYMIFFWLGTVPALSALGLFGNTVFLPLTQKFPKISAIILFCIGCYSLVSRF